MAEEKKFPSVSEEEKQGKGVGALADRPNLAATYGQGGLTAAELKKWFDGLASLIIEKYNLLGADMQSGAVAEYIGVPEDAAFPEGAASTLKDVLTGIVSGALAQYLVAAVTEDASGNPIHTTLSQFVVEARGNIGANYSEIMATKGRVTTAEGDIDSLEGRATSLEDRATSLEDRATSLEGRVTPVESRMTAAEDDIDGLEGRATALEGRAKSLESRASDFDSSFIVTDGRLTTLEGRASTAESNISDIKGKLASFGLLKNVVFDESTDKLTFTFVVGDATKQIPISLADFIDSAELSSQISEKVSALAKQYVDQASASASNASASKTAAETAKTAAESAAQKAEQHEMRASLSEQAANTFEASAREARDEAQNASAEAQSASADARESARKAEMYSQTSEDRWAVFDKRLTNVENGISADPFVTDDTVAYQKTVPANALPFAAIERVGGMSYVSRNLFNIDATPTWNANTRNTLTKVDEVTFTSTNSNNDGGGNGIYVGTFDAGVTITVSGYFKTSSTDFGFIDVLTPRDGSGSLSKEYAARTEFTYFSHTYTTKDTTREYYYRPAYTKSYSADFSITLKNVQIEIGSTATAYTPYFEGIRHAAVTGIESAGKNLFDNSNINYTASGIKLNFQTYGEYVRINGTKASGANIIAISKPNIVLPVGTYALSVRFISGTLTRANTTATDDTIMFGINSSSYGQRTSGAVFKVGDVGTRIFTITEPTVVATFDIAPGYSGIGNVYDNVVVACQLERADAVTDFAPYYNETFPIPTTLTSLPYYGYGINADVNNHIEFETEYVQMCSERAYQSGDENNPEVVTDGTRTVYALPTPVRTPITFMDNYIRVDGSGTLTFVNEHKMAVPSTVLYLTKEASV